MIDTAEEDVAVAANLRDHSAGSLVAMPEISSSDLTFTNQRLQVFDRRGVSPKLLKSV